MGTMSRSSRMEDSEDEGVSQRGSDSEGSVIVVKARPAIRTIEAHEELTSASEADTNGGSVRERVDTIEVRLPPVVRPQDYQRSSADVRDNYQESNESTPHDDSVDDILAEIRHKGVTLYKVQFADGRKQEVAASLSFLLTRTYAIVCSNPPYLH